MMISMMMMTTTTMIMIIMIGESGHKIYRGGLAIKAGSIPKLSPGGILLLLREGLDLAQKYYLHIAKAFVRFARIGVQRRLAKPPRHITDTGTRKKKDGFPHIGLIVKFGV